MTSVASILNDVGVPWPDANTGNAREAAAAWTQLANTAEDALSRAGGIARSLCANNTGPAMDAFGQYWDAIGGSGQTAKLPLLIECCREMAKVCGRFADAVDAAKTKLEETAAEIAAALAGGAVFTLITFGASDVIGDAAAAALVPVALGAIEVLGVTLEELIAALAGGAAMGTLDAMFEQLTSASVAAAFGDTQDPASATDVAWAAALGGIGGVIGTGVAGATTTASNALGATYAEELSSLDSRLPGMIAAIPDALDTPAGKALIDLGSASAANAVTGQSTDPPSVEEILGEVMDAKIEAAGDAATEKGGEGE